MARLAVLTILLGLALTSVARAADIRVPAGQRVDEVKAVGASVRVDGEVRGRVIVIDGDLLVGSRGSVRNPVVLGGHIDARPGATVRGDVVTFGGTWPRLSATQFLVLVLAVIPLRLALAWMLVSVAWLLRTRRLIGRLQDAIDVRPLRALAVGVLAAFGVGAGAVLLALTVLGVPVALALIGVLVVATVVGISLVLAHGSGVVLERRIALVALAIPLVGDALAALAAIVGLGALLRLWGAQSGATQAAPRAVSA